MLNSVIIGLERLGQYEEPIIIHKFRSMYINAQNDFSEVAEENGLDKLGKVINDPRIISFGKFIRRYFIDELPQIYDLQRGVISPVGIRPKSKEYWKQYPENHRKRALKYKPGMLGVPYYYTNLRDFQDCVQAEKEYLDRLEKENPWEVNKDYIKIIMQNIIFKGLRSK